MIRGLGDDADKALEWNARPQRDGQQNAEEKKSQRDIHRCQKFQERKQDSHTKMTDGIGDGAKDAERRSIHHQIGELKHGF